MSGWVDAEHGVTDANTIAEMSCPMCGAEQGSPCVYMPLKVADEYSDRPKVQAKLRRVGTPTQRVHHQRRDKLRDKRFRAYRRANGRPLPPPPPRDLIDAYRAGVEWDRQEHERLRRWFGTWGRVLFEVSK